MTVKRLRVVLLSLGFLMLTGVFVHASSREEPAGRQLLEMVNQERAQAGLSPLAWDAGLFRAALAHAQLMADANELSHQLKGEPSMPSRFTAASTLPMDAEGENVALDVTLEGAHRGLMHSPPHRRNILDPQFNYAGFAVVFSEKQLWVVEDFAHAARRYSSNEAERQIIHAIAGERGNAKLPPFAEIAVNGLQDAACGMGRADSLKTAAVGDLARRYSIVTYTQTDPAKFPASNLPARRDLRNVSVAACFARTQNYPGGVYWVTALFY